jgi:hypothetical protein
MPSPSQGDGIVWCPVRLDGKICNPLGQATVDSTVGAALGWPGGALVPDIKAGVAVFSWTSALVGQFRHDGCGTSQFNYPVSLCHSFRWWFWVVVRV